MAPENTQGWRRSSDFSRPGLSRIVGAPSPGLTATLSRWRERGWGRGDFLGSGLRRNDERFEFEVFMVSSWHADAPRRKSCSDTGNRGACKPAWWRCWRGRAFPAPRAGRRKIAAREWRTSGAANADGHGNKMAASRCTDFLFVRANINLKRSVKGRSRKVKTLRSSALQPHPQYQPLQICPLRKT